MTDKYKLYYELFLNCGYFSHYIQKKLADWNYEFRQ